MSTPKVLSRKSNGTAGGQPAGDAPRSSRSKAHQEGEKVVVRRLPPGLTEDEFVTILGDTWKVGNGKIDWLTYWPGKASQHPSKPSIPSRAYLHVKKRDELLSLSEAVRTAVWHDNKGTHADPTLVFPPVVELAIYKKTPSDRKRSDGRQGTIDQDPEFMTFLESLANPDAHKEGESDHGAEDNAKAEKPTTTPLIEHLREKKAAKAKETAAAKSSKHSRQDSHGGKGKATAGTSEELKKGSKGSKSEKVSDKAPGKQRETVKILTKKAAADAAAEAAKAVALQIQASSQSSVPEGPPKSRRAGIAAAARILQRDLGLSPGNAHRKARQEAAKAESEAKTSGSKEPSKEVAPTIQEPASPSAPIEPAASSAPLKAQTAQGAASSGRNRQRRRGAGTGEEGAKTKGDNKENVKGEKATEYPAPTVLTKTPVILLKKKDASTPAPLKSPSPAPSASSSVAPPATSAAVPTATGPKNTSKQSSSKKGGSSASTPAAGATRAFIKHANQSQGVTDVLLREALQTFGAVVSVEMDRKKGFAYAEFADHESLVRAMAASPILVAQATMQVLERKEVSGKKGAGGGSGGARSSATPAAPVAEASSATAQNSAATSATPTPAASTAGPAEKSGGAQEKHRGGRRRGGRGRGDKDSGGKEGGGKTTESGGSQAQTSAA
ncbi:Smg-4/UPF3 family-domain-containing protein [Lasiosphaeris hirsuta]|uniref:Smg-4/UPF3 family-domain-containing protein n=1 Tax=Lasiosphaeris hirsuta TaxID=260670 RepID=A0AA40DLE2_9PEZI|nr:Smg-4/UPF3 family-domain-containing protein [Lasiosphaeris hirsuta]